MNNELIRQILEAYPIKFKNIYPISYFDNLYNHDTFELKYSDEKYKSIYDVINHVKEDYPTARFNDLKLLNRGQYAVIIPATGFNTIGLKKWVELNKGANMTYDIWDVIKRNGIKVIKRSGKIEYWKKGQLERETMI